MKTVKLVKACGGNATIRIVYEDLLLVFTVGQAIEVPEALAVVLTAPGRHCCHGQFVEVP